MTAPREYKRDPKGSTTGGQFTVVEKSATVAKPRPTRKAAAAPEQASTPSSSRFKTLAPGEHNDPATVREMQQLLSSLGLGKLAVDGKYGPATTAAVKAAQRKLGLRPTGKASKTLVNKLLAAYDLSPCIKRSKDGQPDDTERGWVERKFDPSQPRDRRGRWALSASVIAALKAQGGEQGAAYFDDGRYFDWSTYDPATAEYTLEIGEDSNDVDAPAAQFTVNDYELEQLLNSLTVTRLRDTGPKAEPADEHAVNVAAMSTLGHSDHLIFDSDDDVYIDWSTRTGDDDGGDYRFAMNDADGNEVSFDLTPAELQKLIASLSLSTQAPETVDTPSDQSRADIEGVAMYDILRMAASDNDDEAAAVELVDLLSGLDDDDIDELASIAEDMHDEGGDTDE